MGQIFGALGSLITGQQSADAAKQARDAAASATDSQNQLNQQRLGISQQQIGNYNQNIQPLQAPLSGAESSLLGAAGNGGSALSSLLTGLGSQQGAADTTGIDPRGQFAALMQYLSNPQNQAGIQTAQGQMGQYGQLAGGGSQLAGATPGAIGGNTAANAQAQGIDGSGIGFFQNEAQNGLNPQVQQNAFGRQQQSFDQSLNDIRNQAGGATNIGALINSLGLGQAQAQANLAGNIAGQDQTFRNESMQSAIGAGDTGLNQQIATGNANLSAAGTLDQQQIDYLMHQLSAAGLVSDGTANSLNDAYKTGNAAQQQQLGNMGLANTANQGALDQLMAYILQGQNGLTGADGIVSNIAGQYGSAAANAAQQAQYDQKTAMQNNPFNALALGFGGGGGGGGGSFGSLFGGGGASSAAASYAPDAAAAADSAAATGATTAGAAGMALG